jgi:hypothetical protein
MKIKTYFILGIMIMLSVVLSACAGPIEAPTEFPTKAPTKAPTTAPTKAPTRTPTETPTEVPTEEPIEYGQIKIWNWSNPDYYLTYDAAKWEIKELYKGDFYLESKFYPGCNIDSNGFRDGGPDGPPPYTYESDTYFLADTEFSLELEIPKATGVADMIHVYWDDYAYQLALFPSTENYDECVAEFWEVMELSIANNFGQ